MTGKYLKYLKYLKKEKIKIKGYGTRFARVVSKAKAKSRAKAVFQGVDGRILLVRS